MNANQPHVVQNQGFHRTGSAGSEVSAGTRGKTKIVFGLLLAGLVFICWQRPAATWSESAAVADEILPGHLPTAPREFLVGVEDSELEAMFDGVPLEPDHQTLVKILFQLPRIDDRNFERFVAQTHGVPWSDVAQQPTKYRVRAFQLQGRVKRVERQALLPLMAEYYEYDNYYRVTFQQDEEPNPVLICARNVPRAWQVNEPLDEPASCYGLFLKVGAETEPAPQLIFASNRLAWYPDRAHPEVKIGPDQLLLAESGMDLSLFDDVRDRRGIEADEAECFYQMLAAVGRADAAEMRRRTQGEFQLAPLLKDPASQRGELILVEGTARRITKIAAPPEYTPRLGIDHYYSIDIFVPLDNQVVRLGEGRDAIEFTNNYPVTVCVRDLPAGMKEGEDLSESVRIRCFYFKLWAYRTEFVSGVDSSKRQLSPLLIGSEPVVVQSEPATSPYVTAIAVGVFVLALAGVWIGLWLYRRGDVKFERETLAKQFEVKEGKSLNKIGIESQKDPDFSKLD